MATEDLRYRESTQYRLWSFSPAQLAELREKTNVFARTNISERISSAQSASASSAASSALSSATDSTSTAQPTASLSAATDQLLEFLGPAEELQLLNFYTIELLRAAAFCELPTDIRATAAIFLRRFYITNSIMTYPPTELLKTCLFFGAKAEGFYTRLSQFAEKFPNTTPAEILAGEFLLCQGIRFAFDVRHPYRALEGAVMELRQLHDLDEQQIDSAHVRAREILKFSPLVTDAYFHFTPSQIMLAALSLADRHLAERLVQETFHVPVEMNGDTSDRVSAQAPAKNGTKSSTHAQGKGTSTSGADAAAQARSISNAEMRDKVLGTVEACREMLATEPPERMRDFWGSSESNKIVRPLIRKLKRCHDPDRWDLVALQKAKREQISNSERTEADAAAKASNGGAGPDDDDGAVFGRPIAGAASHGRDAKRRKVSSAATQDPFGGPL